MEGKNSALSIIHFVIHCTSWETCPFHALASMLLCINNLDNYLFPFLSNSKNESSYMNRLFKNLYSKWLNRISATEEGDQQSDNLMELLKTVWPRPLLSKITTHSVRYGSANFLDSNPGILTTWIAERGGWLLESINKVFYFITGQSKTDKKVARVLSG